MTSCAFVPRGEIWVRRSPSASDRWRSLGRALLVLISRARAGRGGAVGAGIVPCPGQLEPGVGRFTTRAPPGTGSHPKRLPADLLSYARAWLADAAAGRSQVTLR